MALSQQQQDAMAAAKVKADAEHAAAIASTNQPLTPTSNSAPTQPGLTTPPPQNFSPVNRTPNALVGPPGNQYIQGTGTNDEGPGVSSGFNVRAPQTPATPPPANQPLNAAAGTGTTATSGATSATGASGITTDAGSNMLTDIGKEKEQVSQANQDRYTRQYAEDQASIQRQYESSVATNASAEQIMQDLNNKRLAAIAAGSAAQKAEAQAAYDAQAREVERGRQQIQQDYLDMVDAQELANKRALVRKETALGVLGGNFSTAGVQQIEDVIMQGQFAVTSLGKNKSIALQKSTDQALGIIDDYKVTNMKIDAWQAEQTSAAYGDLQKQVLAIKENENMAVAEKETALREVAGAYNDKLANLTGQAVQAKYDLATTIIKRSDDLVEQSRKAANEQRDDARSSLKDLVTTFSPSSFASLTEPQKAQLRNLESQAGWPQGFVEQGYDTYKQQSADAKTMLADAKANGWTTKQLTNDGKGGITATQYKADGSIRTQFLGNFGAVAANFTPVLGPDGTTISFDRTAGTGSTMQITSPTTWTPGTTTFPDFASDPAKKYANNCALYVEAWVPNYPTPNMTGEQKASHINSQTPVAGAVAIMPNVGKVGHLAVVKSVNDNGTITIREANYRAGQLGERTGTPQQLQIEGFWTEGGTGGKASTITPPANPEAEKANEGNNAAASSNGPAKTGNTIVDAIGAVGNMLFPKSGDAGIKRKDVSTMTESEIRSEAKTYGIASGVSDLNALKNSILEERKKRGIGAETAEANLTIKNAKATPSSLADKLKAITDSMPD